MDKGHSKQDNKHNQHDNDNNTELADHEAFAICITCNNELETCACVCPFCGERDGCECVLFDAATGG